MAQQLHPPIWRLCEPIEGIESAQIAECLGLDPAKFHRAEMASSAAEGASAYQNSAASARDLSRFAGAEPLTVACADPLRARTRANPNPDPDPDPEPNPDPDPEPNPDPDPNPSPDPDPDPNREQVRAVR